MAADQTPPTGVRLADLDAPLKPVKLDPSPEWPEGRWVRVRPIDGKGYQLLQEIEATQAFRLYWEIARRVLPDATQDEIDRLTPREVVAVVEIAAGNVAAVEAILKNAEGSSHSESAATAPRSRSRRSTRSST